MTVQTIIAILAFVSALVMSIRAAGPFIRELRQKGIWLDLRDPDGLGIPYSRLLDLAFVLISAAFFSLLLVDALLVSGRTLAIINSALATLGITALVSLTLLFMWYRDRAEMGIAWWAMVTLVMLAGAPGGPFVEGKPGTPDVVNLWIPVLA